MVRRKAMETVGPQLPSWVRSFAAEDWPGRSDLERCCAWSRSVRLFCRRDEIRGYGVEVWSPIVQNVYRTRLRVWEEAQFARAAQKELEIK